MNHALPDPQRSDLAPLASESTVALLDRLTVEAEQDDHHEALAELAVLPELADESRAEQVYREAISANACLFSAYSGLTELLCRQGRHDEAIDLVTDALASCPNSARLHHIRGCVLEAAGTLAGAIQSFGRAVQLDATLAAPHYRLGVLCEQLGAPLASARHLEIYERLMARHRSNVRLN